ncbi:hypothetical protein Plhal304r1_c047g0129211 [Plasmopara halstedii]
MLPCPNHPWRLGSFFVLMQRSLLSQKKSGGRERFQCEPAGTETLITILTVIFPTKVPIAIPAIKPFYLECIR